MINVLVVDDNEPVRKSLRYLIETAAASHSWNVATFIQMLTLQTKIAFEIQHHNDGSAYHFYILHLAL
jgi:FixJ family two-component response regulator